MQRCITKCDPTYELASEPGRKIRVRREEKG